MRETLLSSPHQRDCQGDVSKIREVFARPLCYADHAASSGNWSGVASCLCQTGGDSRPPRPEHSTTRRINMLLEKKNAVIYGAGGAVVSCKLKAGQWQRFL